MGKEEVMLTQRKRAAMELVLSYNRMQRVSQGLLGDVVEASPAMDPHNPPPLETIIEHIKHLANDLQGSGGAYAEGK
ncbi:hypothetical protein [Halomonas sp. I5-271120]|uniref:hypothetical protein n=1 Tax=Halomonas sp. I5-271120 TaxID=3061632 RepID=UPI002714714A|nr:hypothetical protein [Halomonas sp. I5-271120]